jgi:hypothetical protein
MNQTLFASDFNSKPPHIKYTRRAAALRRARLPHVVSAYGLCALFQHVVYAILLVCQSGVNDAMRISKVAPVMVHALQPCMRSDGHVEIWSLAKNWSIAGHMFRMLE